MFPVETLAKLSEIVSQELRKSTRLLVSWLNYSVPMTEVSRPLRVEVFTRGHQAQSGLLPA